ncbi:SyrB-like regulator [Rhizobium sp. 18065]|uniref:SyrB-like regulator n=1 Tax=Rhizobium sp. 18065 TaxID=2681411 RepID=UPI0013597BC1|nr:SyrB-like regulator [Rhizobium sp. 18065]
MADETTTENAGNDVVTETQIAPAAVKKTRAPRRSKAEIEAAAAVKSAGKEKPAKAPRAKQVFRGIAAKSKKSVGEPAMISRANRAQEPSGSSSEILDDIATLIELEEENKRLRKQLSDKLRAENADLRKRLGTS